MSDNDQVEVAGLCFPPSLCGVLRGKEVGGRRQKKKKERLKEKRVWGSIANMRQSSHQPLPQIPPPELLSTQASPARSISGLSQNKDEPQPAAWSHSEQQNLR